MTSNILSPFALYTFQNNMAQPIAGTAIEPEEFTTDETEDTAPTIHSPPPLSHPSQIFVPISKPMNTPLYESPRPPPSPTPRLPETPVEEEKRLSYTTSRTMNKPVSTSGLRSSSGSERSISPSETTPLPPITLDRKRYLTEIQKDGMALRLLPEAMKNEENVVRTAIDQNPLAFQFASPDLRNNFNVALFAVIRNQDYSSYPLIMQWIGEDLKDNPLFVHYILISCGEALEFAGPLPKQDFGTVQKAIKNNPLALQFASPELQDDPALVKEAVKRNGLALKFAGPSCKYDPHILEIALNENKEAYEFVPEELKMTPDIVEIMQQQ